MHSLSIRYAWRTNFPDSIESGWVDRSMDLGSTFLRIQFSLVGDVQHHVIILKYIITSIAFLLFKLQITSQLSVIEKGKLKFDAASYPDLACDHKNPRKKGIV